MPQRYLLTHKHAPGDTVVLTSLFRDIKRAYPDIELAASVNGKDLLQNNPHLTTFSSMDGVKTLNMGYRDGLRRQNVETCHFIAEFHRNFHQQTGLRVPVTEPRGDLHLSEFERTTPIVEGPYWVFLSGGKSDFTAKVWHHRNWVKTVELLRERGISVVQMGAAHAGHWHPPIPGALNLVGKTNLRDSLRLIHHSQGVLCGVTFAMHAAAALEKPCVVVAGGREAWWWEAYVRENRGLVCPERLRVPHRFLHTIGLLPCCSEHGCWRSKVVPLHNDKSICKLPIVTPGQVVPKCMEIITPHHVVEAVMGYVDTSYPPIDERKQPALPPPAVELAPVPVLAPTSQLYVPPVAAATAGDVFDHPAIGGKFTIFVLLYGPSAYHPMHRRCLESIIGSVPPGRMDLRIGSNQLCKESVSYVQDLIDRKLVTKHYQHATNDKKYPVMREMFHDPNLPIDTKWLLWFDDDSIADRNPAWLSLLAAQIVAGVDHNCHMYGAKFVWTLQAGQANWMRSRPWYRSRPFRAANGRPSPNGDKIIFVAGGFWALSTEAMRACNIPDEALGHNGGDYTIGEQLWQGGYDLKAWNGQKQFIHTSSVPRRGLNETHIGIQPKTRVVT